MRQWVAAILAVAALTGAISAMPAAADESDAVDCGSTPFEFSGDGYLVDCERHEGQARKDGGSGQSQLDVITVTSDQRSLFLTLISVRLTSTNLYMRYQGLRENARYFFSGVEAKDWNGIGNKQGYDTAEFTADISGQPSHCIAVQRYLNPAFGGYKRQVVGLGCASGWLEPVYSALAKMRAPGD